MLAATNNAQGWTRAGAGEAPDCGMGRPASVAVHQSNCRVSSSLPVTRREKPRVNCRGHRASAFSFTPRSIDLDEIHDLRICELSGRHATLARGAVGQSIPDQLGCESAVGPESVHSVDRLSSSARLDNRDPDTKGDACAGTAFL